MCRGRYSPTDACGERDDGEEDLTGTAHGNTLSACSKDKTDTGKQFAHRNGRRSSVEGEQHREKTR